MVATVIGVVMGTLGLIGAVSAGAAWFYKRGKDEQTLAGSVDRNTEATNLLAAQVGGLRTTLESHATTLTEHHFRLKALEDAK